MNAHKHSSNQPMFEHSFLHKQKKKPNEENTDLLQLCSL